MKFRLGDRVQPTPQYFKNGLGKKRVLGTVTGGTQLSDDYVIVTLDGQKNGATYAAVFWEPVGAEKVD
jgi:hypothetical protein